MLPLRIKPLSLELSSILLVRLFFLWLLAFVLFLIPAGNLTYYALWSISFVATIPYSLWVRDRMRAVSPGSSHFIIELLSATGIVYFTGGIHSQLILLYPLILLSAGIAERKRDAVGIIALGVITHLLMAMLLNSGVLPEYIPPNTALQDPTLLTLLLRSALFAGFGASGMIISQWCTLRFSRQHELTEASSLLQNIPVPALLLNATGRILAANAAICTLLDTPEKLLCETDYASICDSGFEILSSSPTKTTALRHAEGNPIPVAYSCKDFLLPATALTPSDIQNDGSPYQVTLMTFTDISDLVKANRQLKAMERIRSASHMAEQMAHNIRTPLTTLNASVQLLRHYESKLTASDWLPDSPRRRDRTEILNHIEEASDRMDEAIQQFIDFAEFSLNDLISIIKLDSIQVNEG